MTYREQPTFAVEIKLYSGGYQETGMQGDVLQAAQQNAKGLLHYSHQGILIIARSEQSKTVIAMTLTCIYHHSIICVSTSCYKHGLKVYLLRKHFFVILL